MKFSEFFDGWAAEPPGCDVAPRQQGHWFFVPAVRRQFSEFCWCHRRLDAPLASFQPDRTTVSEVVRICARCDSPRRPLDRPEIYVRGTVRHPDRPALVLDRWHRALRLPTPVEVAVQLETWRGLPADCDAGTGAADAWVGRRADEPPDPVMHRITLALSQRTARDDEPGPRRVSLGITATIEGDTDVGIRGTLVHLRGLWEASLGLSCPLRLFTCSYGLPACSGFSNVRMSVTGNQVCWRWRHGPWLRRAVFEQRALSSACTKVINEHREAVETLRLRGVAIELVPRFR